ncbi:MAG: GAF domain-containing sensor histidine kinase [Methanomicrobiales archaeon]|nr:GAF domain-containing sensor histidine kinase [Methanomicrobiales archaeon]
MRRGTRFWLHSLKQLVGQIHEAEELERLSEVLDATRSLLGYSIAAVFRIEPRTRTAVLKMHSGFTEAEREAFREALDRIPIDLRKMTEVLFEGNALYVSGKAGGSAAPELSRALRESGIADFCLIPIRSGRLALGALLLGCREDRRFSAEEREMLAILGLEMGNAFMRELLQRKMLDAMNRAEEAREEADLYLDIMTHDLNNLNNVILGYAGMVSEVASGETLEYATRIETVLRQAIEMIRNVATIRRIREKEIRLRPVELDPVIKGVMQAFPTLRLDFRKTGICILADELLPQIFINLIGNSQKFGGDGVEVAIHAERVEDGVIVTVEDTGPGIEEEVRTTLFQRYGRGRSPKGGKGLGLYIVRMLAERYGGSVTAEERVKGEPGRGTAVKILFRECTAA